MPKTASPERRGKRLEFCHLNFDIVSDFGFRASDLFYYFINNPIVKRFVSAHIIISISISCYFCKGLIGVL